MLAGATLGGCVARHAAPVVDRTAQPRPSRACQACSRPPLSAIGKGRAASAMPPRVLRREAGRYALSASRSITASTTASSRCGTASTIPGAIRVGQQLRLTAPPGRRDHGSAQDRARRRSAAAGRARHFRPPPATDAVKSQPKGVRVPYSDQAYAQLASIKPDGAVAPQLKPDARPARGGAGGEELQFGWPANGKIVSSFNDGTNLKASGSPASPASRCSRARRAGSSSAAPGSAASAS